MGETCTCPEPDRVGTVPWQDDYCRRCGGRLEDEVEQPENI
ncbi:hypothetical protein [Halovivax limisalsi]|nr:hypothetical protein [Halovivax limisalsi]